MEQSVESSSEKDSLNMNLIELRGIVASGESEVLEFKRSTGELDSGLKTCIAMLSGRLPGFVLFGVSNDGEIVGQDVSAGTLEKIASYINERVDPPAFPEIETVALDTGRAVIGLRIPGGSGLFSYEGRPYKRVGATTHRMPQAEYERSLLERLHSTVRWENRVAERFSVSDLDPRQVILTVEEAIRRQRLEEPGTRDLESLLLGLGLIETDGQLLNAAMVLFGRTERLVSRYPQCQLRMARFRGSTKDEFLDNRQEVGNAFELFVRAQRFIRDHLPVAGRVVPDVFERIDDPLYPPEALREALANALCHRDYTNGGGAVSIAIYDDRMEIGSSGPLPFGQNAEILLQPHLSRPWNPLIAQVFYRRGLIEQWGRGTLKIVSLTHSAGLVAPEFEASSHEVIVRFRPLRYQAPTRVNVDLSPLQRQILEILSLNGPSTLAEIRSRLEGNVSVRTVQNNLQSLRLISITRLSGMTRSARWSLESEP